ncbi:MAG: undecaprenyl-diphosphate phosphatase, partial [Acidobacteriota bacterium]
MSLSTAILLGLIQGLTEFLPVSSSGHLAVAQHFTPGFHQPGMLFDIVLHLGTLSAVLVYFRRDIAFLAGGLLPGPAGAAGRRLLSRLALGTVPAVMTGLAVGALVQQSSREMAVVGVALLLTGGLLLYSARFSREGRALESVSVADALTVGVFQSAALLPGISRSGSTIVAGLVRGLSHHAAARFSFLLSVPAIIGAAVYDLPRVSLVDEGQVASYSAGFLTALVVGYFSIEVVLRSLTKRRFHL